MAGGSLAMSDTPQVPIAEFARRLHRLVADTTQGPITITRAGKPVAVLVGIDMYRSMAELEEVVEDLYWAVVALRHDAEWRRLGKPTVPLAEVEARAHGRDQV